MTRNLRSILTTGLAISFVIATATYLFHDLQGNPQYDNQGLWSAAELLQFLYRGEIGEFYFAVRKYPLFYIVQYVIPLWYIGLPHTPPYLIAFFLAGRLVSIAYTAGVFVLMILLGKRNPEWHFAAALLMTSILFLLFSSAIRPHMHVAFWTLLTYFFSLRLYQKHSSINVLAASGSALLAFCTLQSGFLAFIFPLWAFFRPTLRSVFITASIGIVTLIFAFLIGYPYVFGGLLNEEATMIVSLGHEHALRPSFIHGVGVLLQMALSGPFLALFAVIGIIQWLRSPNRLHDARFVPTLYLMFFFGLFTFLTVSSTRYFVPTLPFLAFLGARSFRSAPTWLIHTVLILAMFVNARFAWLALLPNTYEQTRNFTASRPQGLSVDSLTSHFLRLPDRPELTYDSSSATTLITPRNTVPGAPWERCAEYVSLEGVKDVGFLWDNTDWAYLNIFRTKFFGPNISVYCRSKA